MTKLTAKNVRFTRSVGTTNVTPEILIPEYTDATYFRRLENPTPFGTSNGDNFGIQVSTYGDYIAVSATGEENSAGKVYVFSNTTGSLLYTIDNPSTYNGTAGDFFGNSISINNDYLVIGCYRDLVSAKGVVYIHDTATGNLLHTIADPNAVSTVNDDNFGYIVSLSGNSVAVTALQERYFDNTLYQAGVVYIIDCVSGNVTNTIHNPNAYDIPNDGFGTGMSFYGDILLAGAPYEDDSSVSTTGKAYIIQASTGTVLYTLDNPNINGSAANDYFGKLVAVNDTYAMVSAPGEDSGAYVNAGVIYVYDVNTGELLHSLTNPSYYSTPQNDAFGDSPQSGNPLSINGKYGFIGASTEDQSGATEIGVTYMFDLETGTLVKTLVNPNGTGDITQDRFGAAVASHGETLVIGANYEEHISDGLTSGAVYVYTLS